MTSYASKVILR